MLQTNDSYVSDMSSVNQFSSYYSSIHGWLSVSVCFVGIVLNITDIFVLKKTKLVTFTTNLILILIAIFDSIVMLIYIPFCLHYYIQFTNPYSIYPIPERDTYFWTAYSIGKTLVSVTFHSISIWLTVYLAFYRFITMKKTTFGIKKHLKKRKITNKIISHFLSNSKTYLFVTIAYCILICVPIYLVPVIRHDIYYNITSENETIGEPVHVYLVDQSELNKSTNDLFFRLSFYTQAIFAKFIPCILLTIFIYSIIGIMSTIKKNKKRLYSVSRVRNLKF